MSECVMSGRVMDGLRQRIFYSIVASIGAASTGIAFQQFVDDFWQFIAGDFAPRIANDI